MTSPLHQLTGFYLTVDCHSAGCGGERTFAISDLASFYERRTVGEVLRLMRCSRGCGGRVQAAWLEDRASAQPACATAEGAVAGAGGARVKVNAANRERVFGR